MDIYIDLIDIWIDKAHDFLQARVRRHCAKMHSMTVSQCHLKLSCKLSARKVRHDCTQNISKEYSNKQWSLDATVPQKRWTLLYCGAWKTMAKPAWFLQKKYSNIYGKAFTKIILHTRSLWSTCVACNKKGNAYIMIESMLTLRTCHASRMISAK